MINVGIKIPIFYKNLQKSNHKIQKLMFWIKLNEKNKLNKRNDKTREWTNLYRKRKKRIQIFD